MRRLMIESGKVIEVLVVDDDTLMRELLAEWLSEAGYRVRHADNGETALRTLRRQHVGLLVTDMDMPDRDGAQILIEAHRIQPNLSVIAISGRALDDTRNWAAAMLEFGAAKALAKPFERRELLAAVEEITARDNSGAARP